MDINKFKIKNLKNYKNNQFFLIAGPCVVENEKMIFQVAEKLLQITNDYKVPFIFKSSYRKANRSKGSSFTGIGDAKALQILSKVRRTLHVPVITDIHSIREAELAAEHVDVLQIPAFLCRQTDLLEAAAKTGLAVNVKKGQFLSPESMKFVVEKLKESGCEKIIQTERGTTFGYTDLVVDFRGIAVMQTHQTPVVLDVTHSLQQPNQQSGVTGGRPEMIELMSKAGIASGVDGLFIETHSTPEKAMSDGANMLKLDLMEPLIKKLVRLREVI